MNKKISYSFKGLLLLLLLNGALLAEPTPNWLKIDGESRARYESLDGQFRSNYNGSDQGLFFRSLVHVEAEKEGYAIGIELQDSRSYLTDSGSAISSSYINPVDFLQAYIRLPVEDLINGEFDGGLTLGRQTVSIGSKRQIERPSYANVIRSYTGAHLSLTNDQADEFHAVLVVPVERLSKDRADVENNRPVFDEEEFERIIWGFHYRKSDALPEHLADLWTEAFVYGLYERDALGGETPNRRYITPGLRLYREAEPGRWNFDIEGALRVGSRRATSNPADTNDLDVFASQLLVRIGYTFDHSWEPNVAFQYYWASGDKDPNDGNYDQYERLFGSRRTDLNNTSLHGPLTPANLNSLGVRFEMSPTERTSCRLTYSAAFLASKTDAFVVGKQRDPSGNSGSFIGHEIDTRFTYDLLPKRLILELGASALLHGEFTKTNPQAPDPDNTYFGYSQVTFKF